MTSSSDSSSSRHRPIKQRRRKRSHSRRRSKSPSSDSSDSSSSYKRSKKSKRKKENKRRHRRSRNDERDAYKSHKKQQKKQRKKDRADGARKSSITSIENAVKGTRQTDIDVNTAPAESFAVPFEAAKPPPVAPKGPMTQAQYQALHDQILEVIDPHTGRTRWMRGTGEIVERIVSREEHLNLNACATRGDGASFARDISRAAIGRK